MPAALDLLTSPAILFFFVGVVAALARSDLKLPEATSKTLSLYLMLCIGFKGGVEARAAGLSADLGLATLIGVGFSALMPVVGFFLLRRITRLDKPTLAALAATYGSVSVVTFAAGQQHLIATGVEPGGYMAAVLAMMETPAILTALLLLNAGKGAPSAAERGVILREVFVNAAAVMLIGSFVVGLISGQSGMARLDLFVGPLFQGALCLFLLDLGLTAARRLMADAGRLSPGVLAFAIGFPVASALTSLVLARLVGLGEGDAALLAILCGSASYIAVPAAMRLAAPEADEGVYVSASLAVTFPFNLVLGIPLYAGLAAWAWG